MLFTFGMRLLALILIICLPRAYADQRLPHGQIQGVNYARGPAIMQKYNLEQSYCGYSLDKDEDRFKLYVSIGMRREGSSESNVWLVWHELTGSPAPFTEGWESPRFPDPNYPDSSELQTSYKDGMLVLKRFDRHKSEQFETTITIYTDKNFLSFQGMKWKTLETTSGQMKVEFSCGSFPSI